MAHARALRRCAFACVAGAVVGASAALALDGRGALACGAMVFALVVAALLLRRRARWHERASLRRIVRLGGPSDGAAALAR